MGKYTILVALTLSFAQYAYGQTYSISGTVFNHDSKEPVEFAVVTLPSSELWTITNNNGTFNIKNVPAGKTTFVISSLGYVQRTYEMTVTRNISDAKFYISENNLALKEVVISAQRKTDAATTTYTIGRTALDHSQIINVTDINKLLPGGKTSDKTLISAQQFAIRSGSGENGNPTFGSAVEIDGVRLTNNASYGNTLGSTLKGIDTRNISSSNVESIEIITGVPSVEYGDLTNGVVKINTRKGKMPFTAEFIYKPHTKQYSINKGFNIGKNGGIINAGVEHTKSISDLASPHTSYDRNSLSLSYSNTLNKSEQQPLVLKAGVTGNIGGYDSESDPDLFIDTYSKSTDNVVRANVGLNWSVNKPWITNLEWTASVNYNDSHTETSTAVSTSSTQPAIHGREEGYFVGQFYEDNPNAEIILLKRGYWYEKPHNESKLLTYASKLKATWAHRFGAVSSRTIFGVDYNSTGNNGRGTYYNDMSVAPTWHEFKYSDVPRMNTVASYIQEQIDIPINKTQLQLTAGLRSDVTLISGSEYGTVNSLSPRFNMKYNIPFGRKAFLRNIIIRAGWGEASKLPSQSILYPVNSYAHQAAFASQSDANNTAYYAYHILPRKMEYNSDLKWQKEKLREIGFDITLGQVQVSLSYFDNKTIDPYTSNANYTPFAYKYTDAPANSFIIPEANRLYAIDRATGIVTVSDKTGTHPSQQLPYSNKETFISNTVAANGSPVTRRGLEWSVHFGKISALRTSFELNGKYYYYKYISNQVTANIATPYMPSEGNNKTVPYRYIAYYAGSASHSNGSVNKSMNANLIIKTHIPEIKLLVTLEIEGSLYSYSQALSEYNGKQRSFVLDNKDSYFPSAAEGDIYAGNQFVGLYPLYYTSYDDMDTRIPFAEKYLWAKDNDPVLFNALSAMVTRTSYNNTFNADKLSPYFSANIAVTKEIGKYASITFRADNFFNNMSLVKSSQTDKSNSLYNSGYIPRFNYGMSLKITI